MAVLTDRDDCRIVRDDTNIVVKVFDCDGDVVLVAPQSFTDEQVWHTLALMNHAYAKGHKAGGEEFRREFRALIGVTSTGAEVEDQA